MIVRAAAQGLAADRAERRSLVGFLLGRFLQKLAFQTARLPQDLLLQMAERLVRGLDALVQACRQTCLPVGHRSGERLVTAVGLRNRFHAAVVHAALLPLPRKNYPLIF